NRGRRALGPARADAGRGARARRRWRLKQAESGIHLGDCLELVPELSRRGKFDLAYADPPFNAGGKRAARVGRGERVRGQHAYDDAWSTIDAFLGMLEPRLE